MSEMDNIFIWAGRPFVSLPDHQSALDAARQDAMMEGIKEGMRIATSLPIEQVPTAIEAALGAMPKPEALVKDAARAARNVYADYGSKAREAIDYMEQHALAAIRGGAK